MKKNILTLIFLFTLCFSTCVFAAENNVPAKIPGFTVVINEEKIDIQSEYPLLLYKNITYFPLTYNLGQFTGLNITWCDGYDMNVLLIEQQPQIKELEKYPQKSKNTNLYAKEADCTVALCIGNQIIQIDNRTAEYPLLQFRDVIYFPLTWDYAHNKFGWEYNYTKENGLIINTSENINLPNLSDTLDIFSDAEGYVTFYLLDCKETNVYNGEYYDVKGLVKFNKDLGTKKLEYGDFVMEKALTSPVTAGDIRFFSSVRSKEELSVATIENFWHEPGQGYGGSFNVSGLAAINTQGYVFSGFRDDNSTINITKNKYISCDIGIRNTEDKNILLKSVDIKYEIYLLENNKEKLILSYEIPGFENDYLKLDAPSYLAAYRFTFAQTPAWDFRDANGNIVPEGTYRFKFVPASKAEAIIDEVSQIIDTTFNERYSDVKITH